MYLVRVRGAVDGVRESYMEHGSGISRRHRHRRMSDPRAWPAVVLSAVVLSAAHSVLTCAQTVVAQTCPVRRGLGGDAGPGFVRAQLPRLAV